MSKSTFFAMWSETSVYMLKNTHISSVFNVKLKPEKQKYTKEDRRLSKNKKKCPKKNIHDINEIHSSGTKRCSTEQLSSLKGACVSYRDCVLLCEHVLMCTCVFKLLTLNYFQPFTCQRRFFRENVSELAGWLTLPKGD